MKIRAVAFDVDGTLYPNSAVYMRALFFALCNMPSIYTFSCVRKDIRKIRPLSDFHRTQTDLFAARRKIPAELAGKTIEKIFYDRWTHITRKAKLFPHAQETLVRLKNSGLRMAALSDFPLSGKLENWGLDKFFEYRKSCEDIGYLKPNPEPFQDLVNFFGFEPREILYVGNNYDYDIVGAKNQGLLAAHLVRRPPPRSVADFSFSDFRRLGDWALAM